MHLQDQNFFVRFASLVFLFLSLTSCRDEIHKETENHPFVQAPDQPLGQPKDQAAEKSEDSDSSEESEPLVAPLVPVPFLLGVNQYFWGENSLGIEKIENFEDFITSQEGLSLAEKSGATVSVKADKIVISTSSDIVLSFAEIGALKPVEFVTHGHHLFLAADRIARLKVDSQSATGAAGNVSVLVRQGVQGDFELSGAQGMPGKDGECPHEFPECLTNRQLTFAQGYLTPEVTWIETVEHVQNEHEIIEIANQLGFPAFERPGENSLKVLSSCRSVRFLLHRMTETYEGTVRRLRRKPEVSWKGERTGQPGYLSAGGPGHPGQNGGQLKIVAPKDAKIDVNFENKGGTGGLSGRNGIVHAALAPRADAVTETEQVRIEAADLRRRYDYVLHWHVGEIVRTCHSRSGCSETCSLTIEPYSGIQEVAPVRNILIESKITTVQPPPTTQGQSNGTLDNIERAQNGEDGSFHRQEFEDFSVNSEHLELLQLELMGVVVPLPAVFNR